MPSLHQYTVLHEIQIEAMSPGDAAQRALEIHRDPESIATVFTVINEDEGQPISIDLEESSAEQILPISCQIPGCIQPVASVLTARICLCWAHLAEYALKQSATLQA